MPNKYGVVVGGPQPVWPPREAQRLPDYDARNAALMAFKEFLAELIFQRSGENGQTVPFKVPPQNIHIYQPDDIKDAGLPGFGIVPALGTTESQGLGPAPVDEDSYEDFGLGTALVSQGDYTEAFVLECWGSKQAERRALVAGVKTVLRMDQESWTLRLKLKRYYDQVATFALQDVQYVDGDEVARNRRRTLMTIVLTVPEVAIENVNPMLEPRFLVCVEDPSAVAVNDPPSVDSRCSCSC